MTLRLRVEQDGSLRDRTGKVVGRLTSVVMEMYAEEPRGVRGGEEVSSPVSTSAVGGSDPQQTLMETSSDVVEKQTLGGVQGGGSLSPDVNEKIARIWAVYQRVVAGATRRVLDATTITVIRNALKVRDEEACIAAIIGLSKSAFHNGDNDRRKKYLGIRYALKGNQQTGETADERIDKMAGIASSAKDDLLAGVPSAGRDMIRDRQRQVEDMLLHPGDENRKARGVGSEAYLRKHWQLTAALDETGKVVWAKGDPE